MVKTFPHLFPDGKNGPEDERRTKLRIQQWFEQRLLNYDERFAKDAAFLYAATQYIEKNQLQNNINYSYKRGKRREDGAGNVSYSLDDGFSVLGKLQISIY